MDGVFLLLDMGLPISKPSWLQWICWMFMSVIRSTETSHLHMWGFGGICGSSFDQSPFSVKTHALLEEKSNQSFENRDMS